MLACGVFLAYTYSSTVKAQQVTDEGTLTVPANSNQSIAFAPHLDGYYLFQVDTNKGTIQAYFNDENCTYRYWSNGTTFQVRPIFNGSSGLIPGGFSPAFDTNGKIEPEYLIFSNTDNFNKDVNYKATYYWTYTNNFYMIAGIVLTALGAIILFLTLLRNKLREFNKALENHE